MLRSWNELHILRDLQCIVCLASELTSIMSIKGLKRVDGPSMCPRYATGAKKCAILTLPAMSGCSFMAAMNPVVPMENPMYWTLSRHSFSKAWQYHIQTVIQPSRVFLTICRTATFWPTEIHYTASLYDDCWSQKCIWEPYWLTSKFTLKIS